MHSISLAYCTGEPDLVSGYNSQMVECRYSLHVLGSLGSPLQFYQFLQELWEGEKKKVWKEVKDRIEVANVSIAFVTTEK